MQSLSGRCFVRLYYAGMGNFFALLLNYLLPWAKPLIRNVLDRFVARKKIENYS